MLALAVRNTGKLIREQSKSENVRLGRLFTKKDTARLMAGMFLPDGKREAYTVLDPGAGTGILAAAAVEQICKSAPAVHRIFLTCYENDPLFLPMLEDNLERVRRKARHDYDVRLDVTLYKENYLTDSKKHYTVRLGRQEPDKFDLILCRPPVELIEKGSAEAEAVGGVTQLKISAAYLFAATARRNLEEGGQLIIVLPTTVATASSLTEFRRAMAEELSLRAIHLFIGKQKNASRAIPLKKEIVLSYVRSGAPEEITITTSTDAGKPENVVTLPPLPYDFVVDRRDGTLTLPKSVEDTKIVRFFEKFPETLSGMGLKMSTGLVIDSKCRDLLFTDRVAGCYPLIRPAALQNGKVEFPIPIPKQYIAPKNPSLVQRNKNMIFIKRVPAKSDERFLNCAVYLATQLPSYEYISTHNKINFIDTRKKNAEIPARFAYGLFALLNSTIYDRYLSIVSKSKQINAKEMRDLPLPPRNLIENMGGRLMNLRRTDVAACDSIVNQTLHIIEK